MRKVILRLLMLIMLTPSLACAMPVCAEQTGQAAEETQPPCAEHHPGGSSDSKEDTKVKFLLDCMGVDLQKADTASIDKPILKVAMDGYILAALVPTASIPYKAVGIIRGPPPDWPVLSQTYPPIFLTTQRIRI